MGKAKTKVKEARTKEGRKLIRKDLGSLKSLTVQPVTRMRYHESLQSFFDYLKREGLVLPRLRDLLDPIVSDYLEFLWSEGEGRAKASTFLASLQDYDPKLKGMLPGSWRLMKAWTIHEVPVRAPPLTESVLKAMVGWAIFNDQSSFALSLLVGFHGLLRTGELLSLQAWQIHMVNGTSPAVINLGLTKSGQRQGAAESVTISDQVVLTQLWAWKQRVSAHTFLTEKPHVWRSTFSECLSSLKLASWEFRPYSLRRGGATHYFVKFGSLDRVLLMGRWTALKTAKIYLNSGLAMLSELQIAPSLLRPFHLVFANWISRKPSLEPPRKTRRAGGRGKKTRVKKCLLLGGEKFLIKYLVPKFLRGGAGLRRYLGGVIFSPWCGRSLDSIGAPLKVK